jgi:hypothetical protein
LHREIITLYNAGWCRSSSAVLSEVVIGHSKCLSCVGKTANMCMSSVVLDLSFCERSGTCSDHGGWEKVLAIIQNLISCEEMHGLVSAGSEYGNL